MSGARVNLRLQTSQGLVNLYDRMARMTALGPTFIGSLRVDVFKSELMPRPQM